MMATRVFVDLLGTDQNEAYYKQAQCENHA
jgi:hypothetical protein